MTLIVSFVLVVVVSFAAARFSGGTGIADITREDCSADC
jgi:hypothetical protein